MPESKSINPKGAKAKSAKDSLLAIHEAGVKYASEFQKLANDMDSMKGQGSLGPDQVKEIMTGAYETLNGIMAKLKEVAEGVPSTQGTGENMQNDSEPSGDDSQQHEAGGAGLEDPYEKIDPKTGVKEKQGAQTGDKLRDMVASEVDKIVAAKEAKEKLATEFAMLHPYHLRQAKFDEIITSKEPIQILQAKVEGFKMATGAKVASQKKLTFDTKKFNIFQHEGTRQREASGSTITERGVVCI